MKMTTDIPPEITTPDSVETRLGTLHFFDGFPDDATVEKVYDNLDFQRGVQAFLTALPGASLYAMRGIGGQPRRISSLVSMRFGHEPSTLLAEPSRSLLRSLPLLELTLPRLID